MLKRFASPFTILSSNLIGTYSRTHVDRTRRSEESLQVEQQSDLDYLLQLASAELNKLKKKKPSEKTEEKIKKLESEMNALSSGVAVDHVLIDKILDSAEGKENSDVLMDLDDISDSESPVLYAIAVETSLKLSKKDNNEPRDLGKKEKKVKAKKEKADKPKKEKVKKAQAVKQPLEMPVYDSQGSQLSSLTFKTVKDKKKKVEEAKDVELKNFYLPESPRTFDSPAAENNYTLGSAYFKVGVNKLLSNQPCSSDFTEALQYLDNFDTEALFTKYNLSVCHIQEKNYKAATKILKQIRPTLDEKQIHLNYDSLDKLVSKKN